MVIGHNLQRSKVVKSFIGALCTKKRYTGMHLFDNWEDTSLLLPLAFADPHILDVFGAHRYRENQIVIVGISPKIVPPMNLNLASCM